MVQLVRLGALGQEVTHAHPIVTLWLGLPAAFPALLLP